MENSTAIDLLTEAFEEETPVQEDSPYIGQIVLHPDDPPKHDVLDPQEEDLREPTSLDLLRPQSPTNPWDPRLVLDLAIGVDALDEILLRYGLTEQEFSILSETMAFRRELAMAMRDARENGAPFAQKAKVQAEAYLEVLDDLVYSNATPANVRLEAIRSIVKWGRLEPPKESKDDAVNATQINVSINF